MASERVVLIDGTALIYRAYYAIPSTFSTADGTPTNATYGFALMFRKILGGKTPKFGAVIFDAPGGTFRDEKYPEYKAQRPSMESDMRVQIPWIHKVVEAHDFPLLQVPGYEADDVIGTLTEAAVEAGHEVYIVSGDKDFAQLIRPGVRMLDTMRDISYDEELVRKKWGVTPAQFVDHLALMGDSSDNIPGVPGIGQKTSASLLASYETLEGIYEHIDAQKGKRRENLENFRDQAFLSRELATIDRNVPLDVGLDDLVLPPVDGDRVNTLFRSLEFNSLIEGDAETRAEATAEHDYERAESPAAIAAFAESWRASGAPLAVLPVIEGGHMGGPLAGVALATAAGSGLYAPLVAPAGGLAEAAREALQDILSDAHHVRLFHDLRDRTVALERHGFTVRGPTEDTQLASFLVEPTKVIPHDLARVAKQYLQRTVPPAKAVLGAGKSRTPWHEADPDAVTAWACQRAVAIAEVWEVLAPQLASEKQEGVYRDVSLPMAGVLARMQRVGIRVDPDVLTGLQEEFGERRQEVEARVHEAAGETFNLNSPKQLGEVLFDRLGLPVIKRTKTGYSTAADVLERLAPDHAIASDILEWRALDKLINTYTAVLVAAIHPDDGRVHATFQQTAGASGRLITTDPDLQRTPIRTGDGKRIREAFIPREGWTLVSADWSQIELRVLAHFSRDPMLVRAFQERIDLHRQTASRIYDVAPEDVSPAQRNVGKTVNFATIYGQGATALGQQLGVPRKEAKAMIDRYFEVYADVRKWLDTTIATAHEHGFVETVLGRRRYIPELKSNNWSDRGYGERIAANTPIQGSAADICKLAMIGIDRELTEKGLDTSMMVQIHDELLFECPPDQLEETLAVVRHHMETCIELAVPLVVDIGHGASWAAAH